MLQCKFVEFIPNHIDEGVLYVSIEYCTVIHKCVCGCGNKVVTPLSPTDWKLTFDGKTLSLSPSIGNWNFPCRSHYWILNSEVEFAKEWSEEEISEGREFDQMAKEEYFGEPRLSQEKPPDQKKSRQSIWKKVFRLFQF